MKKNKKKVTLLLSIIGFALVIFGSAFGILNHEFTKKDIKADNVEREISSGISELPNDKLYTRNGNNELSAYNSYSFNLNDNSYDMYANVRNRPSTLSISRNNRFWVGWRLTKCPTGAVYIITCDSDLEYNKNMGPMSVTIGGTTLSRANDGDSNYTRGNSGTIYINNANVGNNINVKTQGADEIKILGKGTGTVNFLSRNDEHDITVTIVEPYYVGYDKNYGDSGVEGRIISYKGATYKTRTNWFSRTGYTFVRWNKSSNGGSTNVDAGSNYTIPGSNTVLYAQWRKNNYTITFNTNGANQTVGNVSASYDTNVTIPNTTLTKNGYIFKGYDTNPNGTGIYQPGQTVKNLTSADGATVTLYAIWEEAAATTYTVVFNANGGTGSMNAVTFTHSTDEKLPKNTSITRTGYTFNGWNTAANGSGTSYADEGNINLGGNATSITLYAQWSTISYTINYNLNGGSADNLPNSYNIESGNITLPNPTKKGYEFIGWTGPDVSTPTKNLVIPGGSTENRTYTANYEVKAYGITLTKGTGISTVTGGNTYNYGDEVTLSATLEEGYDFDGWHDKDGHKVSSDINYKFTMSDAPLELEARGKLKTYDVNYKGDDGNNKELNIEYNSKVITVIDGKRTEYIIKDNTTIPDPSKPGYHFDGWEKTIDDDGNVVLTADFEINRYTIDINVENGRADGQSTYVVNHGDDQIIRVIPNDGYAFDKILIDGQPVDMNNNEYEFKNITSDHNVKVTFAEDTDGDGVPDKYEVRVTFTVVNGTWGNGSSEDIVRPYPLYRLNNGVWVKIDKVTLGTIPTVKPAGEYKLGNWDVVIDEDTPVTTNIDYIYNCIKDHKFIQQPAIKDKTQDDYIVDWKINFDPVKIEIIDPETGEVVEEFIDDPIEEARIKISENKNKKYIIRAYYDDEEYIDSDTISVGSKKNPRTGDNSYIYVGTAIVSMIGLCATVIYTKKSRKSM